MPAEDIGKLLGLVRAGDGDAFVRLAKVYAPLIDGEVARYHSSLSPADLEDLRQSALFSLYNAAVHYREDRGVTFGLFAKICVINGAADALRQIGKRTAAYPVEDLSDADRLAGTETPQARIFAREDRAELDARLRGVLSPLEHRILVLYLDGYSYREIAGATGKSTKAVDNAMCRIKEKLRKYFDY